AGRPPGPPDATPGARYKASFDNLRRAFPDIRISIDAIIAEDDLVALHATVQALALPSRIILRCTTGVSNTLVGEELRITDQTVCKWRGRFVEQGVAGLLDEPRSGAPRKITNDQVEAVVVKTLESAPRNATHWSTRSMAAASGISRPTRQPHLAQFRPVTAPYRDLQVVDRSAVG